MNIVAVTAFLIGLAVSTESKTEQPPESEIQPLSWTQALFLCAASVGATCYCCRVVKDAEENQSTAYSYSKLPLVLGTLGYSVGWLLDYTSE